MKKLPETNSKNLRKEISSTPTIDFQGFKRLEDEISTHIALMFFCEMTLHKSKTILRSTVDGRNPALPGMYKTR